ncbi:MAG: DUF370 domain-containing protein [Ruminococcus callidus]|nr:DUF370 domain-containing protein [Ruminococcus callidus]
MYIHLGNEISVSGKCVTGIFDLENTTIGKATKEFLDRAERENRVVNVSYEMPKSFIVCNERGREVVYISQISVATLRKRAKTLF